MVAKVSVSSEVYYFKNHEKTFKILVQKKQGQNLFGGTGTFVSDPDQVPEKDCHTNKNNQNYVVIQKDR
jgi:hypothetical protein